MEIRHAAPVALRRDFTGQQLRIAAKQTKNAAFTRRLLALAEIYDGAGGAMRPALAASACRQSAIGCCALTPGVPTA